MPIKALTTDLVIEKPSSGVVDADPIGIALGDHPALMHHDDRPGAAERRRRRLLEGVISAALRTGSPVIDRATAITPSKGALFARPGHDVLSFRIYGSSEPWRSTQPSPSWNRGVSLPSRPASEASAGLGPLAIETIVQTPAQQADPTARSVVSANTAAGSRPETKVFEQRLCATKPVATRMARSGRNTRRGHRNGGQEHSRPR